VRLHLSGSGVSTKIYDAREIPFGFAQGRLSLRLKNGCAQDDAGETVESS
jgi:hypothetical protein